MYFATDFVGITLFDDTTFVHPHGLGRHGADGAQSVRDEHDRAATAAQLVQFERGLLDELRVAARERLVDEEDLRVEVHRDGEREAHAHPARVRRHREVEVLAELREVADRFGELGEPFGGEADGEPAEGDVRPGRSGSR